MHACFVEMAAFERVRERYLDDSAYAALQRLLLLCPEAGVLVAGTGGLRKLRFGDGRRRKGRRGGLRVIYYHWAAGEECWLFTVYDKDEANDLTPVQRALLKERLKREIEARRLN